MKINNQALIIVLSWLTALLIFTIISVVNICLYFMLGSGSIGLVIIPTLIATVLWDTTYILVVNASNDLNKNKKENVL